MMIRSPVSARRTKFANSAFARATETREPTFPPDRMDIQRGTVAGQSRRSVDVELDALSQRQVARVVDRRRHAPHIGLPRVAAGFAAAAGFLLAAKGAAHLRAARPDIDRSEERRVGKECR